VLSPGTLKNYYTTEKYVKKFLKDKYKCNDIFLSSINYQFITEFEFYLRTCKPLEINNPLTNNGIMKHMERLRKMVTMSYKMEWIIKDPFSNYKLKFKKKEMSFLNEEELYKIEHTAFSNKFLERVRDLFIFSCYTGLSYIDLANLTTKNITIGIDGEYWIKTSRQKTEVQVNIPLLPKAFQLIQKYRQDPRVLGGENILPLLSNQKINSNLKEIARLCGLDKSLTFHCARHTFATTITLTNGVPLETVSKMLGHTKLTTTQIYVHVIKHKISEDMKKLKEKLNEKSDMHEIVTSYIS
ncbi:MAG: site-specific integrase, partial [Ginsengibacter sp.]